jgi:hypothetical protein
MRGQDVTQKPREEDARDNLTANIRRHEDYDLDIRDALAVAELFKSYCGKSTQFCNQ